MPSVKLWWERSGWGGIERQNERDNDRSVLLVSPGLNRIVDRGQTQLSRARKRHTCIVKIANIIETLLALSREILSSLFRQLTYLTGSLNEVS